MHVCGRRFNVHQLRINLLIEHNSKTNEWNTTKNKFVWYLCFIVVVFIQRSHHRLKLSSFSLKKKFGQSIWTSGVQSNHWSLRFVTAMNTSSWKDFTSKGDSSHFENSPSFQISCSWSYFFQINENLNKCPPCLLAEIAKMASSVTKLKRGEYGVIIRALRPIRMSSSYIHLWKLYLML